MPLLICLEKKTRIAHHDGGSKQNWVHGRMVDELNSIF
jgi:hypothetical protein